MPQDDLSDVDPQRAAMAQFDAWLALPEAERAAWLAALAQRDAPVHARVQRLIESGVMQVVAVTDPIMVGFSLQAMIGVRAEGDLDFRGTLGVDRDAPVGFREIRLHFDLVGDLTPEELEALIATTERYCVVFQTLATSPQLSVDAAATT